MEWAGPELPEMPPDQRKEVNDFLFWAVEHNQNTETLRNALAQGAEPNAHDDKGRTPLMLAAELGKTEYIQILKDAGAKE